MGSLPPGRRRRLLSLLRWGAAAVGLYALLGFFVAPPLARPVLKRKLSRALHREVSLRGLALNPLTLSATLRGLSVAERKGPGTFLSFERLHADLQVSSLWRGGPVVREVLLEAPSLLLVREEDGTYNVSDLLDELAKEEPGEKPARFAVNNIRVTRGAIVFDDRPRKRRHEVRDLEVGIPFLSNIPSDVEIFTQPELAAKVNGAPFALHGRVKPFSGSRETSVEIDLTDVDLPFYLGYLPKNLPVALTAGRLDVKALLSFSEARGRAGPTRGGRRDALVLSGSAALRDAAFTQLGRPLLSVRRLDAVLASYDVFRGVLRLTSVTAAAPELHLRRGSGGRFDVSSAFPSASPPSAPAGAKGPGLAYEVGEVRVEGGAIDYEDASLARPFAARLAPVSISLRGLSSAKGKSAALDVTATSDAGETLKHAGDFTLEPFSAEGSLELAGVPLGRYAPWWERTLLADLAGTLDLGGRYRIAPGETKWSGLSASVRGLRAAKRGAKEAFLKLPAARLEGGEVDLTRRALALGALSGERGYLAVRREADGSVDLGKLLVADRSPAPPGGGGSGGPAWTFLVRKLSLDRFTFVADDLAPRKPAHLVLSPASVEIANLALPGASRAALSTRFVLGRRGLVTARGPIGLSPVYAELKVRVSDLDLLPVEPYVFSQIRLSLTEGTLDGSGTLSFRPGPGGAASVWFSGDAAITKLVAVEEESKEDFLRWDSASAEKMRAGFNPAFVEAAKLSGSGVVCHVGIADDGTVNLRAILGAPKEVPEEDETGGEAPVPVPTASAAAAQAPPEPPMPVRVDSLTLTDGTIELTDHLVKPSFSARLAKVSGQITGLSSVDGTKAEVDLRGTLDGASPIEISGTVNLLAAARHAAIRASCRDVDLVPMTPYFGRYAGYAVSRGKLTLTIDYRIQDRKLEADNKILLDQFTFGDKVESAAATKLPVKLAVSLLKDRRGVIDLDVPISGSLDDPKFRLGKIVWKVLGNLLAKAVTSPFALFGKLFGGGEELSNVEFEAGRDTLGAGAKKRLDALAAALQERPALKLRVAGLADEAKDAEGLRRARFERKVKAQKMDDLLKRNASAPTLDDVVVPAEEWPVFLKKAYRKEKFKKPRTSLGFAKDLTPDEMERLMLANVTVAPEDLRQLALSRAEAVKAYLLATGKVEAARVFLAGPEGGKAEAAKGSRVDFALE